MRVFIFFVITICSSSYANDNSVRISLNSSPILNSGHVSYETLIVSGTILCTNPHIGFGFTLPYSSQVSPDGVFKVFDVNGINPIYLKVKFENLNQIVELKNVNVVESRDLVRFRVLAVPNQNIISASYRLTVRAWCYN